MSLRDTETEKDKPTEVVLGCELTHRRLWLSEMLQPHHLYRIFRPRLLLTLHC